MCDHEDLYQYFPSVTIGGPTGNYFVVCPVTSARWVEYAIMSVSNGDGGTGSIVISGDSVPTALSYDGSKTLSDGQYIRGAAYRIAQTLTLVPAGDVFDRVTHSQKCVFVRIDAAANTSMFVTIRFRARLITKIPGPSTTVHPDHAQALNIARSDAVKARLHIDKEIAEGEGLNARKS